MVRNAGERLSVVEVGVETADELPRETVRKLYDLLGSNMTAVIGGAESAWDSDEEFEKWAYGVFHENLKKGTRHILLFDGRELRGFLSYTVSPGAQEIYLNEFQVHHRFRGGGVTFKLLLVQFLQAVEHFPYARIRTYTNKRNVRVQTLIEKIGFQRQGQTERGFQYVITRRDLQRRVQRLHVHRTAHTLLGKGDTCASDG